VCDTVVAVETGGEAAAHDLAVDHRHHGDTDVPQRHKRPVDLVWRHAAQGAKEMLRVGLRGLKNRNVWGEISRIEYEDYD